MAGRQDSRRPIRLATLRSVTVWEAVSFWQHSRIFWTFVTGSTIIIDLESMLKPRKVIICVGVREDFLRFTVKPRDWRSVTNICVFLVASSFV